jgi:hypothetical protein
MYNSGWGLAGYDLCSRGEPWRTNHPFKFECISQ